MNILKKDPSRKSFIIPLGVVFFGTIIIGGAISGDPELLIAFILTGLFYFYVFKIYPLFRTKKNEKLHLILVTAVLVVIIFGIQYLLRN